MSKEKGCPCGTNGKCCKNPQTRTPEHTCSDEDVCEECYVTECINCGSVCYCEL